MPEDFESEDALEEDFETQLDDLAVSADGGEVEGGPELEAATFESDQDEEPSPPVQEEEAPAQAPVDEHTRGILHELSQSRQQSRVLESRMTGLLEVINRAGMAEQAANQPAPPTFDEDPESSIRRMIQEAVTPLVQNAQSREVSEARQVVDNYSQEIQTTIQGQRDAFIESTPDYLEAEKFLIDQEIQNVHLAHPDWNAQQVEAFIVQNVITPMQVNYYQQQANLPQAMYERAKLLGWQQGQAVRPRGKRSSVTARQLKGRQAQARSLSAAPRGGPRKARTTKDVINMSDEDYAEYLDSFKNPEKVERELAQKYAVEM